MVLYVDNYFKTFILSKWKSSKISTSDRIFRDIFFALIFVNEQHAVTMLRFVAMSAIRRLRILANTIQAPVLKPLCTGKYANIL